jgi:hypothetical protein
MNIKQQLRELADQLHALARTVDTLWDDDEARDARRRALDLKQSPEDIGAALNRTPAAVMARLRKDLDRKVYNAWLKGCRQ